LNISGNATLNNVTTIFSSLNVSGLSTFSNNTIISGNIGLGGITNPDSKLHIQTLDNVATTSSLLNFKNSSNYGIYATSTSIGNRGNTVDFFARDYNLTGGVNKTTRSILSLNPDGKVGIGTLNISGLATLNNSVTCISSLNVSGITTLTNITTCASSLNVSGFSTFDNASTHVS